MKIRFGYVSNSSSSSFIVCDSRFSLNEVTETVEQFMFDYFCEQYMIENKVNNLNKRQLSSIKRKIHLNDNIGIQISSGYNNKKLNNKIEIYEKNENYIPWIVRERLENTLNAEHIFH